MFTSTLHLIQNFNMRAHDLAHTLDSSLNKPELNR